MENSLNDKSYENTETSMLRTGGNPPYQINADTIISFTTKEDFVTERERLEGLSEETVTSIFNVAYSTGFRSLRPFIVSDSESYFSGDYEEYLGSQTISEDGLFEETYFIGNDIFASLLNYKGEIAIGDSIYRYTDKGMLFADYDDRYIIEDIIKGNTPLNPNPLSEITYIGNGVNLFIPHEEELLPSDPTDWTGDTLNAELRALLVAVPPVCYECEECSGQNNGAFNVFGKYRRCHKTNPSDDKKRIRIAYWKQNYWLFKHIGTSTKHQLQRRVEVKVLFVKIGFNFWARKKTEVLCHQVRRFVMMTDLQTFPNPLQDFAYAVYDDKIFTSRNEFEDFITPFPYTPLNLVEDDHVFIYIPFLGLNSSDTDFEKIVSEQMWSIGWDLVVGLLERLDENPQDYIDRLMFTGLTIDGKYVASVVDQKGKCENDDSKVKKQLSADFNSNVTLAFGGGSGIKLKTIYPPKFGKWKIIFADICGSANKTSGSPDKYGANLME